MDSGYSEGHQPLNRAAVRLWLLDMIPGLASYFLADLPPGSPLTAAMVAEACRTLKNNRAKYLANKSPEWIAKFLSELAADWLRPDYKFRILALTHQRNGFSKKVLEMGLDVFFSELTYDNIRRWYIQEFGDVPQFNTMVSEPQIRTRKRAYYIRTPELIVHFTAGTMPIPALMSMVTGLLLGSAQFLKLSSSEGADVLPRLFAHSIYAAEPKLASCIELAVWPGGKSELEEPLFQYADCVTVSGSDQTIQNLMSRVPLHIRFVPYRHRVSFSFVAKEKLFGTEAESVARLVAEDVSAWDQLGCLSPHVVYVETGGQYQPRQFAELLAIQMEKLQAECPTGPVPPEIAAAIATRRTAYLIRAANNSDTMIWHSTNSNGWTVVYEDDSTFQFSCLYRFVYVKGVQNLGEALRAAEPIRHYVSTVGVAASDTRLPAIALELARWGALRICPIGKMQAPMLQWRHDGRPALTELVTWVDWELE